MPNGAPYHSCLVSSEVSVCSQSTLLLLYLDEAEHHDRVGREGQTQPITLGLLSDGVVKFEYETSPMGLWIEVGPQPCALFGRWWGDFGQWAKPEIIGIWRCLWWAYLVLSLSFCYWSVKSACTSIIWSHGHDVLPKPMWLSTQGPNLLKPFTQAKKSLRVVFPGCLSWWCKLCLLRVGLCHVIPSHPLMQSHLKWPSLLVRRLW